MSKLILVGFSDFGESLPSWAVVAETTLADACRMGVNYRAQTVLLPCSSLLFSSVPSEIHHLPRITVSDRGGTHPNIWTQHCLIARCDPESSDTRLRDAPPAVGDGSAAVCGPGCGSNVTDAFLMPIVSVLSATVVFTLYGIQHSSSRRTRH
ncbi:hypothetical protein DFH09DRAFT_158725 [Mycena vulgaris]|nr:hypothetical protein DFH09DRAFT_158725 [Mycena vulgaris]